MPSVLPQLFDFWFLIPFVLRLALGVIFIVHGFPKLFGKTKETKAFFESLGLRPPLLWALWVGIVECVGGIFLVIGLFVQPVALLLMIDMFFAVLLVTRKKGFVGGWEFEFSLFVMALALAVMGAGAFAIDLPF